MPFVNANSSAAGIVGAPPIPLNIMGGKVRSAIAEFTCATDVVGVYTVPIRLPRGARVITAWMNASATMGGSATIALGIAGADAKYRAGAVFTTANALTFFALNAAVGVELAAEEQIIMTVAVASLPASGRLLIGFIYVENN